MTPRGPRFLDEDQPTGEGAAAAVAAGTPAAEPVASPNPIPHGPVLFDAEPDAPERLDVGWMPAAVAAPRTRVGAGFWLAAGLCTLVVSWLVLSLASFVLGQLQHSIGLGVLAALAVLLGVGMLAYAAVLELRAYRSLGTVARLRAVLATGDTPLATVRAEALAWLAQVGTALPDWAAAERLLQGAASVAEVRGILRSQVADRLREAAGLLGRRAAVEGATLVAVCPHPAWDGLIAGVRGLLVVRQVAALHGLRPGLAVTLALVRRVAWTAAGTAGIGLVSQHLADQALSSLPVVKHVAGALPETSMVAVRLYRLAGVTAEACSPVA